VQSDDAMIVKTALRKLYEMIVTADTCEHVMKLEGQIFVVLTMRKWSNNASILYLCCLAIGQLIYRLPNRSVAIEAFLEMEAMELIVAAMKQFPNALDLQWYCTIATGNLLCITNDTTKAAATKLVHDLGGLDLVVAAMKSFRTRNIFRRIDVVSFIISSLTVTSRMPCWKLRFCQQSLLLEPVLKIMLRSRTTDLWFPNISLKTLLKRALLLSFICVDDVFAICPVCQQTQSSLYSPPVYLTIYYPLFDA
jgi:hypothetical protein